MKKKKIKIFMLIIILLIIIFTAFHLINKQIFKINDEKIINKLQELKEEEINYVFLEINPKFVFEVKNDKVISVGCLNDDCMEFYDELNIKGKSLIDAVDYVYNYVKEKKYGINNAKVRVYKNLSYISDKSYIQVEVIDEKEKEKLLSQVINNEQIKEQTSKEAHNIKLWDELRKDKDYGKIYECLLNEEELECYIKKNLLVGFTINSDDMTKYLTKYDDIIPNLDGIGRVLNKFGLETKSEVELGIFKNPTYYAYVDGVEYREFVDGEDYLSENIYYSATINCNDYRFDLTSINLLKIDEIKPYIDIDDGETVFEESTTEYKVSGIIDDIYAKKQVRETKRYCENNTIKEKISDDKYIIYRIDGGYSVEVSKEAYDDFNTAIGEYMEYVEECKFVPTIEYDGNTYKKFKKLEKPANGKYCKYQGNIMYYSDDDYLLFEY